MFDIKKHDPSPLLLVITASNAFMLCSAFSIRFVMLDMSIIFVVALFVEIPRVRREGFSFADKIVPC